MIRRLMLWAFERLYNEAAWAYDLAAMVAGGRFWYAWGQAALPFVGPGAVLEVGVGRGKLLPALDSAGHTPLVGVELSPAMLRAARATLRATATPATLVRASGGALPFAAGQFATLITTFPAPYVATAATQREFARVLRPGGRWLWVDAPRGSGAPSLRGGLTTLLGAPPAAARDHLAEMERQLFARDAADEFDVALQRVAVGPTTVMVRVATKRHPA